MSKKKKKSKIDLDLLTVAEISSWAAKHGYTLSLVFEYPSKSPPESLVVPEPASISEEADKDPNFGGGT